MGWARLGAGPNHRDCWVYETPDAAILVPYGTVSRHSTRSTILGIVARILFGRSRAQESATPTKVWRLDEAPTDLKASYWKQGTMVQALKLESEFEVRRAAWLRIVGPVQEELGSVENASSTNTFQARGGYDGLPVL